MLAAIAAPGMIGLHPRQPHERTSARQFDADLLLARREAIKRNYARAGLPGRQHRRISCGSGTTAWTQWMARLLRRGPGQRLRRDRRPAIRTRSASTARSKPTLTLTGPAAVARFNANGTQGAAGAGSLTFTTRGDMDRLEILRRDRHRHRQCFDGRRELT